MEIVAQTSVRIAPRKVRLVADAIRKVSIDDALQALAVMKKRAGGPLEKTLRSAIANAINNNNLKQEDLKLKSIDVLEASSYKRFHASTRGRVHPYKRRGSHIKIVLETKTATPLQKTIDKSKVKKGEKDGTKS